MFHNGKLLRHTPPLSNHVEATKQKRMLHNEFR